MSWSFKLGRFAGIDVFVHATFFLLLGYVGLTNFARGQDLSAALAGVGFILALFLCVVLHEYGHALTARRYGIKTRDITLLPIGGVARLERMPDDPREEFWVALAGPAVNVVIAALLFITLQVSEGVQPLDTLGVAEGSFLQRLMVVNISLVLFNLIPAFPMDGGRVLRALLATRMDYVRATQTAAQLGQAIAFIFGFIGLFSNPLLLFVALFVYIGAQQEASMVQMRSALSGIPVSRAMLTDFRTLTADDPLNRAVDLIIAGSQHDFPVLDRERGRVVGLLLRGDLIKALAKQGPDARVADAMRREFQVLDSFDMLDAAFGRMQTAELHTLPVLHNGELVGLLTDENVGEFMMIQSALGGARDRRRIQPAGI